MKDLIQKRLERYNAKNAEEELMGLKEITQEVILYSLYNSGFFEKASFLGGTSLRILHGIDRFSEDLDFSTKTIQDGLEFDRYLEEAGRTMVAYGYDLSINKKDLDDRAVQSRFIKDDSIKKVLSFKYFQDPRQKIKIKIEIDTSPPLGAVHTFSYVDFPEDFPVSIHDLPTLLAGKLHALLCRRYSKGRDWYDFLWYVSNKINPNLVFLKNALFQFGPWKGKRIEINSIFIKKELTRKIQSLDWADLALDVRKFLTQDRAKSLDLWSIEFFESKLKKL